MEDLTDSNSLGEIRDEPLNEHLLDENEALKQLVTKLETEKISLKSKLKEMGEETVILQKRLQEISVDSDKESTDPLSELDKQEELLKNISTKNKHIKRLIKDIETLQLQNIEQSKTIIDLEQRNQMLKSEIQDITNEQNSIDLEKNKLDKSVNELTSEITRLEGNITYLEDERDKADLELKDFIEKLEERANSWRHIIIEKEKELHSLRKKYEILNQENPMRRMDNQFENLIEAVQERDKVIEELEKKLKSMADEMITSTQLMNRISTERETEKLSNTKVNRTCCKIVQDSLNISQKRCHELLEMLDKLEEDNLIISKQKLEAIKTLEAYKSGEDGLSNLLHKINKLEQKLTSRDKQIKALVMEINSLHEISQENTILRKRLNIPDDLVVSTVNLVAKQRNKDKIIERLKLKLRASEEIRLQLKLDKSDLMKELIESRKHLPEGNNIQRRQDQTSNSNMQKESSFEEIGLTRPDIYCDHCLKNIQILQSPKNILQDTIKEWEQKYTNVIEENENLRVGMHEILEKIREYDVCSDHITIDCSILEKVLHALDARSISGWYHPAMRMQNELIAIKQREQTLKETIQLVTSNNKTPEKSLKPSIITQQLQQTGCGEDDTSLDDQLVENSNPEIINIQSPVKANEKSIIAESYSEIVEKDFQDEHVKQNFINLTQQNRELHKENETLKIYEKQYTELLENCHSSDNQLTNYCSSIIEQLSTLEIQYKNCQMKYEYLKSDFDDYLTEHRIGETKNLTLIADLKKELNNKRHEIGSLLLSQSENLKMHENLETDEILILKKKNFMLECQLATMISEVFNGKVPNFELMPSSNRNIAIIKENMQLDFITEQEYEQLKKNNQHLRCEIDNFKLKTQDLQNQLTISQEQVYSQHKLIMEITDNHIDLRHLVADLQTTSEDKYLITKYSRDLKLAKEEINKLQLEKENFEKLIHKVTEEFHEAEKELLILKTEPEIQFKSYDLKIKFLKNYIVKLQENFCQYTPLVKLTDFVTVYTKFMKKSTKTNYDGDKWMKEIDNFIDEKLKIIGVKSSLDSQDLIKIVKYEIKCKILEEQLINCQENLKLTEKDLEELRISSMNDYEYWKTIQVLFSVKNEHKNTSKYVQTEIEIKDNYTNTDPSQQDIKLTIKNRTINTESESPVKNKSIKESDVCEKIVPELPQIVDNSTEIKTLENQLKQAMNLASQRSILLLETENKLAEAVGRIGEMEKTIRSQNDVIRNESQSNGSKKSSIIETTITSLQSLISEKDTTLRHYQELLKTEREQHLKSCETYDKELDSIKKIYHEMENTIESRNNEISELRMKIDTVIVSRRSSLIEKSIHGHDEFDGNCDNSLNEISDEKIEEMFMDESKNLNTHHHSPDQLAIVVVDECPIRENHELQIQMREARNRLTFWEKSMRAKDEEISFLKEKLSFVQDREKIESSGNAEIEQLRILLEEKDKHINDLMDTLSSFHDDQQRFLNETSIYSADQMTQLGTNLSRSETTNKILQTQISALKRQLNSLSQREKHARDLSNSLKNQLIKRPVVSMQTELNTRSKNEQQQKRIGQLESELEEARKEILRQRSVIDVKRAKNVSEISLWEKQKKAQQNAEKFKLKLEETEKQLEKTKGLLNAARNTVTRMEKDKTHVEQKSKGGLGNCCKIPSCPNLFMAKYIAESPERRLDCINSNLPIMDNTDIINKLKFRIEAQQRRINAYELAGTCSSSRATEFEKLQETVSALEAQNIRWEAKVLQLQLENDMLRQGDQNDRSIKRIKHLEDYILALKEELAKTEAKNDIGGTLSSLEKLPGKAEQTILALKRIVERLKSENKNLKEGFCYNQDRKCREPTAELIKLRTLYKESLDKISALQIDLTVKNNNFDCKKDLGGGDCMNEFQYIKLQLNKKTELLEKAKILLTRAAAKEKSLKDQLSIWKRKCSELQNVPVIDEISE